MDFLWNPARDSHLLITETPEHHGEGERLVWETLLKVNGMRRLLLYPNARHLPMSFAGANLRGHEVAAEHQEITSTLEWLLKREIPSRTDQLDRGHEPEPMLIAIPEMHDLQSHFEDLVRLLKTCRAWGIYVLACEREGFRRCNGQRYRYSFGQRLIIGDPERYPYATTLISSEITLTLQGE
jgi:hypothetical protein